MSSKRITIAIPDTGPLISLAMGGALDLLLSVRQVVQIAVTDVVYFEATYLAHKFADGADIADFFEVNKNRISIVPTTVGHYAIKDIKAQLELNPDAKLPEDLGELSIVGFIKTEKQFNPGEPTMVLIEDDWFVDHSYAVLGNVHLVSTSSFLDGLERFGYIPSAVEIKRQICAKRPGFRESFHMDRSAEKVEGGTNWAESFRSTAN